MINKTFALVTVMATGFASAAPAFSAVAVVPASKDAMMFATSAGVDTGNASGKGPALFAGADGSSNRKRSLLAFDLSSIPGNATVTSATVTLYLAQVAGSGGGSGGGSYPTRIFSLLPMLQDWGEGSSGSPTNPSVGGTGQGYARVTGDSTWDYAFYNAVDPNAGKWKSGGTDLHGGNFAATASATSTFTSFSSLNAPYSWTGAGLIADVQSWITGSSPNDGWLLRSDNLESSPTSFLGFWSKDGAAANGNSAIAPMLTVTYAVPEPATMLAASSIVACVLQRRRSEPKAVVV